MAYLRVSRLYFGQSWRCLHLYIAVRVTITFFITHNTLLVARQASNQH